MKHLYANQEKADGKAESSLERMKAAIYSILSDLKQPIKNQMEEVLMSCRALNHKTRSHKKLTQKI
jgi:hypothetical protein